MVRFVDELYVSDTVRPKVSAIKWKMMCGIGMTYLFFITLADNSRDLFDIYPAARFKQKHMRKSDRVIIGIADSYKAAGDLISRMVTDCMERAGDLSDVRGYYESYIKDHL